MLVSLVMAYEARHYPVDLADAVEAIKHHMDRRRLEPSDLIPFIGSRQGVWAVLARKRPLTLAMIRRLHDGLGIPAEVLIREGRKRSTKVSKPRRMTAPRGARRRP